MAGAISPHQKERGRAHFGIVVPSRGTARVAIPKFIKALRSKIGTDLLQVPTVSVLAYDDQGQLLLVQDKSSGLWGYRVNSLSA